MTAMSANSDPPNPPALVGDAPLSHGVDPSITAHAAAGEAAAGSVAAGGLKRQPPAWSSPLEALILVARGYTFRTGVVVSSVVGTLLSAVNEGSVIASGHPSISTWVRVATNYAVPFVVASIGYLTPFRSSTRSGRVP